MKKNLLIKLLATFLTGTMLIGVGCKDYDDDIQSLNNRIDELTTGKIADIESQINSMNTAIENLKALETRIKALEDAQVTDEDLQKLQDAIDAIEANYVTTDHLTTTLSSYATTKYVGEAIKAATDALGKFTSEQAIQEAIDAAKAAAIKAAGEACEAAFQTSFDNAVLAADLASNSDVAQAIADYDKKIQEQLTKAVEEGGFISEAIAEQIKAAVDAISAKIAGRLTSIQLIPELYIDGIETIELKSLRYKAWTVTSTGEKEEVAQGNVSSTTAQTATDVRYLISPSVVTKDDIKEPSYIYEKAEIRTRSTVKEQLLDVADYKIENGVMTVSVKKHSGAELAFDGKHIYTTAIAVPIADKWLGEGETGTTVYSDFVALSETTIDPKIAELRDGKFICNAEHFHHYATYDAAKAGEVAAKVAYNESLDLLSLVTGCYIVDRKGAEITKSALAAAGLEFRFALPTVPFTIGENETDQQQFASIAEVDGKWLITSKLPDGTTNNKAAIDKTPVVRVELVDVNNNNAVADVRYLKIQWDKVTIAPVELGVLKTFEYTLGCSDFEGKFFWSEMINKVLGELADKQGMSQDEFLATFDAPTIDSEDHEVGLVVKEGDEVVGNAELTYNFDVNADESAAAFIWSMTTEQIGNVIDKLLANKEVKYTITIKIPGKSEYQGAVTFSFEVIVKKPELPTIYGYDSSFWHSNYDLAHVYPIQYNTPGAFETCAYRYELDRLFADSKPVKGLKRPCGKWDIQFALQQPTETKNAGYAPTMTKEPAGEADKTGYVLNQNNLQTAVQLVYTGMGDNWYAPDVNGVANAADITVQVMNNEAGIGLLGKEATLKVWGRINAYNVYEIDDFNVYFVEPLKINSKLEGAYFVDQVVSGSTIDCSKAFTMTDFKDYIVAKVTTGDSEKEKYAAELYKYYAVVDPVWNLKDATTNLKKDGNGNYVVDETITAETATIKAEDRFGVDCITADATNSTLTFKNVKGVKVEKTIELYIPVTVKHKWGTLTETVTVLLYPEEPVATK